MIKMGVDARLGSLFPRGSVQRFGLIGSFNSLIFFILWEIFRFVMDDTKLNLQIGWGVAWGMTGLMAHFIHRHFTFDPRKGLRWTVGSSTLVYIISLVGSTVTIGWFASQPQSILRWIGLLNIGVWGIIVWALLRVIVFQFKSESTLDQTA